MLLCFLSLITWPVSDVQIVECHDQMVGRESNNCAWGNEEEKQGENSASKGTFPLQEAGSISQLKNNDNKTIGLGSWVFLNTVL